jgi:hypothetical protein
MANATLISHDSQIPTREVESLGDTFSLAEMQKLVDGHIELVRMDRVLMVVNEEGMLLGLPINYKASAVAGTIIRGNALLGDEGMIK